MSYIQFSEESLEHPPPIQVESHSPILQYQRALIQNLYQLGFEQKIVEYIVQQNPKTRSLEEVIELILQYQEMNQQQLAEESLVEIPVDENQQNPQNQQNDQKPSLNQFSSQNPLFSQNNHEIFKVQEPRLIHNNTKVNLNEQYQHPPRIQRSKQFQSFDDELQFSICEVCQIQRNDFLVFKCKHKFCWGCVLLNISVRFQGRCTINQITCLSNQCHETLTQEDANRINPFLTKPRDSFASQKNQQIEEEISSKKLTRCKKCGIKHESKFLFFGTSCSQAENKMLNQWIEQDQSQGANEVQQCPNCGLWCVKEVGCNSVTCHCNYNWCWLCRAKMTDKHYQPLNPLSCIGLGNENIQKSEWPWFSIFCRRVKKILLYISFILLMIIVYPFFISYLVFAKFKIFDRSIYFVRDSTDKICGFLPLLAFTCRIFSLGLFFLFLPILFLLLSALTIFPGIPMMICSQTVRNFIFMS